MDRRDAIATIGSGVVLFGSGCVGFLAGSQPLSFEATKATVLDHAVQETGYEEERLGTQGISRTFSVAGQSREVEVTNWIGRYERSLELGPLGEQELGVFVVLSTPQVEVLDRTFNPVGEMSTRELLARLQSRYDGLSIGSRVDTTRLMVLDEAAEVEKFNATATFEGRELDLVIHVTTVAHASDYVVPIAVYPKRLPGEEAKAFRLYRNLEH